jgi:hypothetical protein
MLHAVMRINLLLVLGIINRILHEQKGSCGENIPVDYANKQQGMNLDSVYLVLDNENTPSKKGKRIWTT